MNIEATVTKTSQINETPVSSTQTSTNSINTDAKSFKDELESVKSQDTKETKETQETKNENSTQATQNNPQGEQVKASEENVKNNVTGQISKSQIEKNKESADSKNKKTDISESLDELSSKIATLNQHKILTDNKIQEISSKKDDKSSDKQDCFCTMKMDNKDAMFFVNLTQHNQQNINVSTLNNNSNEAKTEATTGAAPVSQVLIDALSESMKTNKPFRIDFDNNVAVVMRVDKEGVLSANFIPGNAAVEAYLRNNIDGLRQNFDNQNLPYNQLSYSREQKQNQQQKNNKENENE